MYRLVDFHQPRYVHTHCAICYASVTIIAAERAKVDEMIHCWCCHAPVWQLVDRPSGARGVRYLYRRAKGVPLHE